VVQEKVETTQRLASEYRCYNILIVCEAMARALLCLAALLFILTSLGAGLFISTVSSTQQQAGVQLKRLKRGEPLADELTLPSSFEVAVMADISGLFKL
jgi:hypothetical protein